MSQKILSILTLLILSTSTLIAGSSSPESSSARPVYDERKVDMKWFKQGMAKVNEGDYKAAIRLFKKADREKPNDPDILNMLAFSYRNVGKLTKAFEIYDRALVLRPRFPQAREYLGQAHIKAALQQINKLKSYGSDGAEDLKKLVTAFKEAAAGL